MRHPDEITLRSYAKINLSLEVTGRRDDGYHEICSLMQGIDLYDVIKITKCPQNGTKYNLPHCTIDEVVVYLCTDAKTIPVDMSNLAFRGIKAVLDELIARDVDPRKAVCDDTCDLIVDIDKRLPVAAGIAGGSGNAAVCMLGLNALTGNYFSLRELMSIGASVGADVPFSLLMNARANYEELAGYAGTDGLNGGSTEGLSKGLRGIEESSLAAWTAGIGDVVKPATPLELHTVIANPGIQVSTRAAYEAIDAINEAAYGGSRPSTGELFINDLEGYTLKDHPEATRLKKIMCEELDADMVLMSGSGPTMVAYYRDRDKAAAGYGRMKQITEREKGWRTWLTVTGSLQ